MTDNRSPELIEAVSRVVFEQPFYASLLYSLLELIEDPNTPTAATDEKRIWIGNWFKNLPLDQRMFVLCHEVMHVVLRHLSRAKLYKDRNFGPDLKPFDFQKWNKAGDYYINFLLDLGGIGKMPPQGLLDHSICCSPDVSIDSIYLALPDAPEQEQGEGEPGEPGEGPPGPGDNFDQHIMPTEGDELSAEEVKQAVVSAANAAKAVGKMPAGMQRAIDELLTPAQPWIDLLKDFVTISVGKEDTSWAKPNRRRLAMPPHVHWPGTAGHAMGVMVVSIDTSGSISQEELTAFITEMSGIIEQVRPTELWVAWWDTNCVLERVEDLESIGSLKPKGGGGTDYRCVLPAIEDAYIEPEIVVCCTDGYVTWGEDFPYNHLTVTTGSDCPFGRNVHMDIRHDYV